MLAKLFAFIGFVLLSFALEAQEVLGFGLTEGRTKVQIPIEIQNNLIIIPLVLNGQVPLKFILDTGVRTSILTEKTYSDILNLPYTRKYSVSGPGGSKIVDAYVTNNVTLDLPGIHGEGHALLVLDQDYLELRNYLGTDVQGILGYELFSRFVIQVNYEKKVLIVQHPDTFKPKKKFDQIPIVVEDTKPYLSASVKLSNTSEVKVKLLVDSGASHGLILEPNSDPLLKVPDKHIESLIGRGLGGIITGQIGRIKALQLGQYTINDVICNFPDPNSYMDSIKNNRHVFRNGAIGGEILSRFNVIFNFPGEKILFKKNSSFKKEFYFNLSGLTLKAKGSRLRKYEITDVRESSTAAGAGLKKGDIVLVVNGITATDLDLNSVNGLFNSKPGRRIYLEIERDGVRMKKEFRLENQI